MTARNSGPGGRIPPDGRAPKAPGVGAQARRHDLERPATPGLAGSDLQQGDVQTLTQGQQIAPIGKRTQSPNPGRNVAAQSGSGRESQFVLESPDPMQFASQRLRGSFSGAPMEGAPASFDPTPWLPLLRRLVTHPGAGGTLTEAYVAQLSNLIRQPQRSQTLVVNMNDMDDALEASF